MPQILVVADIADETANRLVYRERIATSDLESQHFSGQLVERVSWAVHDADEMERQGPVEEAPRTGRPVPSASPTSSS
jgi:hypothetical protein